MCKNNTPRMFAKGTLHLIIIPLILSFFTIILNFFIYSIFLLFLFFLFFIFGFFFLIFFRDPDRGVGSEIVAVADGKIIDLKEEKEYIKIVTFMNIFNVHVNRMPINGKIVKIEHFIGKHMPAFFKDSKRNERVYIEIESEIGIIKILQIAGIIARRIVPYIKKGDILEKGTRVGIIRFGSRVDLYLPKNKVEICVKKGDKVKASITTIARKPYSMIEID